MYPPTTARWRRLLAPALILVAGASVQTSAAFAHHAFSAIGALHVTALRFQLAALVLLVVVRPDPRGWSKREWLTLAGFGLAMAVMNASFYQAVARMPLGNVTSIEFTGPFLIAAFSSRGWRELRWVLLAAAGVLIVAHPGSGATPSGVAFALLAAAGWASYTLLSKSVGSATADWDGLAISVAFAGVFMAPVTATAPSLHASVVGWVLLSALFGVVIGFALEMTALRKAPAKTVAIFFSFDPVMAFVVGVVLLSQPLRWPSVLGASCIVVASIAVALDAEDPTPALS